METTVEDLSMAKPNRPGMHQPRLGFNSYTLKQLLESPEQIRNTFKAIGGIGYTAVELDLQALLIQMDRTELRELLRDSNVFPFSAHVEFEQLEYNLEGTLDDCKYLGLDYVVVPNLPRERFCESAEGYRRGTQMLKSFAQNVAKHGMKFAYHNHGREFEKFDGKVAMDLIFGGDSELLAEIDIYWVQFGGADPMDWISKFSGRVPLVHLKDMGVTKGKQISTEIGEGNLNWKGILGACRRAGVEWYIVEQEDFAGDPLDSIRMSKTNLDKLGIV
jgi:sugar phosphate isomerase/epimerase